MSFPKHLARALAPVAIVALAVPAEAQQSDIAKVEAHLSAVQSMTANFTQTDSRNRVARGTLQLKRPGRIRFQ
jgi:outer membrane lipoprotein-sorting protein